MNKITYLLLFLSFPIFADDAKWMQVRAVAEAGTVVYVGKINQQDLDALASDINTPMFLYLKNLVIIDERTGVIQSPKQTLANRGKSWSGDELYIRTSNIIEIQSMNKQFAKDASKVIQKKGSNKYRGL